MAKHTCDFKHKIYCNIYIAKHGRTLYFTFSRGVSEPLPTFKQGGYLIGGN